MSGSRSATATDEPDVRELFDANAETYDRVNTIISLGLDSRWRDWVAREAVSRPEAHVLDAFAGTGLVGLRMAELGADVTLADISPGMLAVAARRARARGVKVDCVLSDLTAPQLVIPGAPFDSITMVFGVRYLDDPATVLRGLATQLADGGRFVVMEFAEPTGGLLSRLASFYFFRILPPIASAISGRRELYRRLTETTRRFHGRRSLEDIVREAGLTILETRLMGLGIVVGIVARSGDG